MASDLHALLKRKGFSIYVDLRQFGRLLRARLPLSAARRRAEYVLIDGKRVPLAVTGPADLADFERRVLADVVVRDGLGYIKRAAKGAARAAKAVAGAMPGGPSSEPRPASRASFPVRHDRQPARSAP